MQDYILIKTLTDLTEYLDELNKDLVVLDIETTSLELDSTLLGIQLYDGSLPPCYISIQSEIFNGVDFDDCLDAFCEYNFQDWLIMGHNIKFDLVQMLHRGFPMPKIYTDTLLAVHVYDPDLRKKLETRVAEDLGYVKDSFEEIIKKKWHRIDWLKDTRHTVDKKTKETVKPIITLSMLAEYGCEDVYYTLKLWEYYLPKLKEEGLDKLLFKIEVALLPALIHMKLNGVKINTKLLEDMGVDVVAKMDELEELIYDEAGCKFNINSSQQKAKVLFEDMNLPIIKTSPKTGMPSSDAIVLSKLAEMGETIASNMLYRSTLNKLYTGYIKAIPDLVDKDGRLRADFNSAGTTTGRFSSSNPNLQNQPNNSDFPIRKAFVPSEGNDLIVLDWSQIELRVMAHCTQDKAYMDAFFSGLDVHQATANLLGITRKHAKGVNFGIPYGMGAETLAGTLKVSISEAEDILRKHRSTYKQYWLWDKKVKNIAATDNIAKTIFGRVRRLPGREAYKAPNTIIQGSSADLMKICMVNMHNKFLDPYFKGVKILMTVHDEIILECPEHLSIEVYDLVEHIMNTSVTLKVPLKADGKIVKSWDDMKDEDAPGLYPDRLSDRSLPTLISLL